MSAVVQQHRLAFTSAQFDLDAHTFGAAKKAIRIFDAIDRTYDFRIVSHFMFAAIVSDKFRKSLLRILRFEFFHVGGDVLVLRLLDDAAGSFRLYEHMPKEENAHRKLCNVERRQLVVLCLLDQIR